MIETGSGDAAYYADITQAVLTLAITAPGGPPADGTAFLDRLETGGWPPPTRDDPGLLAAVRAPAPSSPTSPCVTGPCCTGSAPPWTAGAPWPTRTPGTSSWKAPANSRWPKPRRSR